MAPKPTMLVRLAVVALVVALVSGCSLEVGSREWCEEMKQKPKGGWTASEAADFVTHCVR